MLYARLAESISIACTALQDEVHTSNPSSVDILRNTPGTRGSARWTSTPFRPLLSDLLCRRMAGSAIKYLC